MQYNFSTFIEKPQRVDIYLSTLFSEFSRSYIQKMIDNAQVTVNDAEISKNVKIGPKDRVCINIIVESIDILPEDMNLDVIYEDKDILIINKEPGINTHPTPWVNGKSGTLVNGILHHCKEDLPLINGVERPWIVHRLDKDTSGAIMIAKSDSMMKALQKQIQDREVDKYYLAIVTGVVKQQKFTIESYIWRHPNDRMKMTTQNPVNPKIAVTHWELISYIEWHYSLLKIKIETGRTHQIRVHLASIGFPIIGDKTYGNKRVNKEVATTFQLHRQALHAYELWLELYWEQKTFIAPLKDDMKNIIDNYKIED